MATADFGSAVTKQTFTPPVPGSTRSASNSEPRVTSAVSNTGSFQDDLFEYADRTGAYNPGPLNSGWNFNNLASKSTRSLQLNPQAGGNIFSTSNTTLSTFNDTHVSDQITITTTFDNAKIMWWIDATYSLNTVVGTGATNMSEINFYLERSTTPGFAAGTGTPVLYASGVKKNNRAGLTNNSQVGEIGLVVVDTVTTATSYYYRITAKENQNTAYSRLIIGTRSTYTYLVLNGFS